MIVVGGVYREECLTPKWSRIFGSGGRAAAALSMISPNTELHGYVSQACREDVALSLGQFGVQGHLTPIATDIHFRYFHPLSRPELLPTSISPSPPLKVTGRSILRFGFVEGDAVVTANRAVFDPQHSLDASQFHANGSRANELAIVLNEDELHAATGLTGRPAAERLLQIANASVVVTKRGALGAAVCTRDVFSIVPAFVSSTVFKIGSGDIFSAVFAHTWAELDAEPAAAAAVASRSVARYAASRNVQVLPDAEGQSLEPASTVLPAGPIYIAAPFFTLGQRWVVEELREALLAIGVQVFSPLHDVGFSGGPTHLAAADLAGLRQSSAVLAVLDGEDAGTLFEVGYARARDIPIVALAESPRAESLTMLEGSGCRITQDICSAVYHSIWTARR